MAMNGIEDVLVGSKEKLNIYNSHGVLFSENITVAELRSLIPGYYIVVS